MILKNSKSAMDIITATIEAKTSIALESFSSMTNIKLKGDSLTPMQAPKAFREFSVKINDVYETLQNISVDESELVTLLKAATRSPKNMYDDASVLFINPDNVGRINADYIEDFSKEIDNIAERIIDGDITSISQTNISPIIVEGIKKQLVSGTYKGTTSKNCFGELPKGTPYQYDSSFINMMAIPFVKTFGQRRMEVASEITALERASESAFAIISTISQSKEIMGADTDARQLLQLYLTGAANALLDIVSFASYLIIRKIDILIIDATALNEMCDNIRSNSGRHLSISESVEDEEVPQYNLENSDRLLGTIRGVYSKIKYNIVNHYAETSHPIDGGIVEDMLDQYRHLEYPTSEFIQVLMQKRKALELLTNELRTNEYPVPEQMAKQMGLFDSMLPTYKDKISDLTNISLYTQADRAGAVDKAFAVLAELKDLEKIVGKIAEVGNDIMASVDELAMIVNNPTAMASKSTSVRSEVFEIIDTIEGNICGELIPEIFAGIDRRCMSLDAYVDDTLSATEMIVPDMSPMEDDDDYVEYAMESVIEDEEIFANTKITEAMNQFARAGSKSVTFLSTEAEMPSKNPAGATPGNLIATDTPPAATSAPATAGSSDSNKSVEVTEDDSKKSATDVAQDAAAADKKQKDPKSFKDMLKSLSDTAMQFFENMINNFTATLNSARNTKASEYITANKEAILARNFNGVTLKIPSFTDLTTSTVIKEIGQVSAAVSALNAQSISSSDETKIATLLFPFIDVASAKSSDEIITMVKEKYMGKSDNKKKEEYSGAKLRNKTQSMMTFCENYYVDKKGMEVATALGGLKTATKSMLTGLSSVTDMTTLPPDEKVRFINRAVKMFSGAITTSYRNQASAYMSALKSLTPKKKAAPAVDPNAVQGVPQVDTGVEPAPTGEAIPTV